jgi:hypothetical protein
MRVCATRGSQPVCDSEKNVFKNIERKKIHKVSIFQVCGGTPLFKRCRWEFARLLRSPTDEAYQIGDSI